MNQPSSFQHDLIHPTPATPGRKALFWELVVYLLLIVPSMVLSFWTFKTGSVSFVIVALATLFRDLALVGLILVFLSRDQEPLPTIGWTKQHLGTEVLLGLILFVPMFYGANLLDQFLQHLGLSSPKTPLPLLAHGTWEMVLAAVLVVVVAISEETIFRGYLIRRFSLLTKSPAAAVIISSFIFSLGHGYEGSAGVITVGMMGLVFSLVYLWRGSLVAPMVMHFCQDFISIVIVSLLNGPKT